MLHRKHQGIEIKEVSASGELAGYASVFGVRDSHGDIVERGAFERTIQEHKDNGTMPKFLLQHDTSEIIGEHLTLREDSYGLYFEARLYKDEPAIPEAARAYALAKNKQLNGVSIGFTLYDDGEYFDLERNAWILTDINLWENSLVTFASNPEAQIETIKSHLRRGDAPPASQVEKALKSLGLSNSQAKRFMAEGYKTMDSDFEFKNSVDELLAKFNSN